MLCIGKHIQISRNFLSSSYHNTKSQLSDKNITTYTLGCDSKSCYEVNQKLRRVLLRRGQNVCV